MYAYVCVNYLRGWSQDTHSIWGRYLSQVSSVNYFWTLFFRLKQWAVKIVRKRKHVSYGGKLFIVLSYCNKTKQAIPEKEGCSLAKLMSSERGFSTLTLKEDSND